MFSNKSGLDEMQIAYVNKIGNQMFKIMFFALFIEYVLYGRGIIWLAWPDNVLAIISACMIIYIIRRVAIGAYVPNMPDKTRRINTIVRLVVFAAFAALTAIMAFVNLGGIVFWIGVTGTTVMVITQIIIMLSRKISDKGEE
jgi:hypothetical protein